MSWPLVALADMATIAREGIAPESIATGTIYVGLENIDGLGNFVGVGAVNAGELASTKFRFTETQVLFGKLRPYLRKTARPNFSGVCSTDILPLSPTKHVDRDYLFHVLRRQSFVDDVTSLCAGANLPRISPTILEGMQIPLPPPAEQRRIAAILNKADALRAKRREAIAKLNQLLQSVFLDMFGDPVTNPKGWSSHAVGDVSDVQGGLQMSPGRKSALSKLFPYLRVANVHRGFLDLSEIKEMGATEAEANRTILRAGDILVVEGHGNPAEIGRCAVWNGSIAECIHQNHLIRVRAHLNHVLPTYLESYLNSEGGRRGIRSSARTTSGLNTISVSKVREAQVLLPPLKLQQRWDGVVSCVAARRAEAEIASRVSESLFSAVQEQAFSGKL